jgi:hypothetical protein
MMKFSEWLKIKETDIETRLAKTGRSEEKPTPRPEVLSRYALLKKAKRS